MRGAAHPYHRLRVLRSRIRPGAVPVEVPRLWLEGDVLRGGATVSENVRSIIPELTALEKAKAAMVAAKVLLEGAELDHTGNVKIATDLEFARLLRAAEANASIALVEAVEHLTQVIGRRSGNLL